MPILSIDVAAGPLSAIDATNSKFLYLRVEPLLDQAADILDRCVRDRADYDDKAAKLFNLVEIEISQFEKEDLVHQQEIDNGGYFDLPFRQSSADLRSEKALFDLTNEAKNALDRLIDGYHSGSTCDAIIEAARDAATVTQYANYQKEHVNAGGDVADGMGLMHLYHPDASHIAAKLHIAENAAVELARHSLNVTKDNLIAERSRLEALRQQTLEKSGIDSGPVVKRTGTAARAAWDELEIEWRRARTAIAREMNSKKQDEAKAPYGALNYRSAMDGLVQRFTRDIADATVRMKAAWDGLDKIYGYNVKANPFPSELPGQRFDGYLVAVRNAISWILRFTQSDQIAIVPISLKALDPANWDSALARGIWTFELTEATRPYFKNWRHVRIRGISVYCEKAGGAKEDGVWQCRVSVPRHSYCVHADGAKPALDQTDLHPCFMGRASSRSFMRDPEISGTVSLYNASPFSEKGSPWELKMEAETSTAGTSLREIEDIIIDIHLAVQYTPLDKDGL